MRKGTLAAVAWVIAFPAIYFLPAMAEFIGVGSFSRFSLVTTGLASFVAAGILTTVLTPLNRRLLDWRKACGRDIEEEERYESKSGMISLTPNDDDRR